MITSSYASSLLHLWQAVAWYRCDK